MHKHIYVFNKYKYVSLFWVLSADVGADDVYICNYPMPVLSFSVYIHMYSSFLAYRSLVSMYYCY